MHAAVIALTSLALVACSPDPSDRPPPTDASVVDEYDECATETPFTRTVIEGTTPIGFFDGLSYAYMVWEGGFCGGLYVVTFMEEPSGCVRGRSLRLWFRGYADDTVTLHAPGAIVPAYASYTGVPSAHTGIPPEVTTEQVEFRVAHLDPPNVAKPRVAGRFVSTTGSEWTFDIFIDLVSVYASNCI